MSKKIKEKKLSKKELRSSIIFPNPLDDLNLNDNVNNNDRDSLSSTTSSVITSNSQISTSIPKKKRTSNWGKLKSSIISPSMKKKNQAQSKSSIVDNNNNNDIDDMSYSINSQETNDDSIMYTKAINVDQVIRSSMDESILNNLSIGTGKGYRGSHHQLQGICSLHGTSNCNVCSKSPPPNGSKEFNEWAQNVIEHQKLAQDNLIYKKSNPQQQQQKVEQQKVEQQKQEQQKVEQQKQEQQKQKVEQEQLSNQTHDNDEECGNSHDSSNDMNNNYYNNSIHNFETLMKKDNYQNQSFSFKEDSDQAIIIEELKTEIYHILCVRHCLTALSERMWEFAIVLLLTSIWPRNFTLLATYGIFMNITVALCSPNLGTWIDSSPRLYAARFASITQNLCIFLCAVTISCMMFSGLYIDSNDEDYKPNTEEAEEAEEVKFSFLFIFLLIIIHITGAGSKIFSGALTIILEKDWLVVIYGGDKEWLRKITATLKQIDLGCKVIAPVIVASILYWTSPGILALLLSIFNIVMVTFQLTAISKIYNQVPALGHKEEPLTINVRLGEENDNMMIRSMKSFCQNFVIYFRQKDVLSGIALSLLYCTVLSFASIMTSFLLNMDMDLSILSITRGSSAVFGVIGLFLYPILSKYSGVLFTGFLAIWYQAICIAIAMISLLYFMKDNNETLLLIIFTIAVAASRLGLYSFDVAVVQIYQHNVHSTERGAVGSTQNTINAIFELTSFVLALVFNRAEDFIYLAIISTVFIGLATLLYTCYFLSERGTMFSYSKPFATKEMLKRVSRTSYEVSTESYQNNSPKTIDLNPQIAKYESLNKTSINQDYMDSDNLLNNNSSNSNGDNGSSKNYQSILV